MCYRLHHPGMVWTTLLVYLSGGGWQNRVSQKDCVFLALPEKIPRGSAMRGDSISDKVRRLRFCTERWPSGLRRTLGKRV